MAETSTKVFVYEAMGRHAGWLAAAAGLAGAGRDDAPQLILFPERPTTKPTLPARRCRGQARGLVRGGGQRGHPQPTVASSPMGQRDSFRPPSSAAWPRTWPDG